MNLETELQKVEQIYQRGEIEKSLAFLREIEKQIEKEKEVDMKGLAKVWATMISFYQYEGKLDKAIKIADKALKRIKDKTSAGYCDILRRKGFVCYLKGDIEQFLLDVNSALEIAGHYSHEAEKAGCLGVLGIYYQECDDFEKALECYQQAIEIRKKMGDKEGLAKLRVNLGTLYKGMKKFEESEHLFKEALETTKERRVKINCHLEMGRLFHAQGDISGAKKEVELALKIARPTKFMNEKGDCYRELARIAYREGKKKESRGFYQKALEIFDVHGYTDKARKMREEISERFDR